MPFRFRRERRPPSSPSWRRPSRPQCTRCGIPHLSRTGAGMERARRLKKSTTALAVFVQHRTRERAALEIAPARVQTLHTRTLNPPSHAQLFAMASLPRAQPANGAASSRSARTAGKTRAKAAALASNWRGSTVAWRPSCVCCACCARIPQSARRTRQPHTPAIALSRAAVRARLPTTRASSDDGTSTRSEPVSPVRGEREICARRTRTAAPPLTRTHAHTPTRTAHQRAASSSCPASATPRRGLPLHERGGRCRKSPEAAFRQGRFDCYSSICCCSRRGGRAAECVGLENRNTGNRNFKKRY